MNKQAYIKKNENGIYWLIDAVTENEIDGSKRLWVVKDMAKRWGYDIVKR